MFKILKLELFDYKENSFTYAFESGINYFVGKNNSGKTEFYKFIDYMFGASEKINNKVWYKGTLQKAKLYFAFNNIEYRATRIINNDRCFFSYKDENDGEPIDLYEYRNKIHSVFSVNHKSVRDLQKFTGERLTYRTFTMFNFLGELRQGVLVDFFDKCSQIQYSTKVMPIINYIFNKNVERIFWLQNKIAEMQNQIKENERISDNSTAIINKVNHYLHFLNMKEKFNGYNKKSILDNLNNLVNELESASPMETKELAGLETVFNNISEQIKVYEKYKNDLITQQIENKNREAMLTTLQSIVAKNNHYEYLVAPIIDLVDELKKSISFSQYMVKDEVILKLKKQREQVKQEIIKSRIQMERINYDDKRKAIAIIEDGIRSFPNDTPTEEEINNLKKKLNEYKKELRDLQDSDDFDKINKVSSLITDFYKSAYKSSDFVKEDFDSSTEFHIKYNKKRNSLQTMTKDEKGNEIIYSTGSHARHTLIQLCGYLVFLKILIEENKYPLIPIFVIDHISKPFSNQNLSAIGSVIDKIYEYINKDDFQIFIFDDKECDQLNINPQHNENLVTNEKTGFNPFFQFEN